MVPISYIVRETGMSYADVYDGLYHGEEGCHIKLVYARLRGVDNTDFAEMVTPILKGYNIPKKRLIECGISKERLDAILSGNLGLSHCDREFIEDVIKDNSSKKFDPVKYFKSRLETFDTLSSDQMIECKSPEECEKLIENNMLVRHFTPNPKGCFPFTELNELETSARLVYKSKNKDIDWNEIARMGNLPLDTVMQYVNFEKGNPIVQKGIGDAIDVYLSGLDNKFNKEEYLHEYIEILPTASVAACVTQEDCNNLLERLGIRK